ncbi:MAG: SMC-Scp complex subunit ScpB [Pirellulales bacterium]
MDAPRQATSRDDADELAAPSDDGLSLDQLNEAFASLLGSGDDPYQKSAPGDAEPGGASELAHADALADAEVEDEEDDACEISPRTIFEAMLFVGRPNNAPLAAKEVASLMRGVRPDEIDALVDELNAAYDERGCPYHVVATGPGYRLALRSEFDAVRDQVLGRLREARLSQAAIDVMALVAYHQPVTSEEVARLRGKPSGSILAQLVRRQLLRIDRGEDAPADRSRKPRYATTRKFLEFFNIENLDELPRPQDVERR